MKCDLIDCNGVRENTLENSKTNKRNKKQIWKLFRENDKIETMYDCTVDNTDHVGLLL